MLNEQQVYDINSATYNKNSILEVSEDTTTDEAIEILTNKLEIMSVLLSNANMMIFDARLYQDLSVLEKDIPTTFLAITE